MHVSRRGCPADVTWTCDAELLIGREVQRGHGLWWWTGETYACSPVAHVTKVREHGAFSPVTLAGAIVVDAMLAHSSTSYEDVTNGLPFGMGAYVPSVRMVRWCAYTHVRWCARAYQS